MRANSFLELDRRSFGVDVTTLQLHSSHPILWFYMYAMLPYILLDKLTASHILETDPSFLSTPLFPFSILCDFHLILFAVGLLN